MPRYRRYRRYRSSHNQSWLPMELDSVALNPDNNGAAQAVTKDTIYKIGDFKLGANADEDVTLERIRGYLTWYIQGQQVSGFIEAVVFGIVLPDIVQGNVQPGKPLPNCPSPGDIDGTDDFPLILPACMPVGTTPSNTNAPLMVDSKARRKMDKDKLLTIAIEVLGLVGSPKITVLGILRALQRIRK